MRLVALDTETHLFQPGLMAPRLVCSSYAIQDVWEKDGGLIPCGEVTAYVQPGIPSTIAKVRDLLNDPQVTLCLANAAYDMVVLMAADPSLIPLIFKAYQEDRIFDVLIGASLIAIHQGNLGYHPRTKKPIKRYSLSLVTDIYLGRDDAKKNDSWRLRYGELDGVPLEKWPAEARQYPLDDAQNTLEVALAQLETGDPNLSNMGAQTRAALALHLSSVWGIRTDAKTVAGVEAEVDKQLAANYQKFMDVGLIEHTGKTNTNKLKTLMAKCYGASGPCPKCKGSGKVRSTAGTAKTKSLIICRAKDGGCDGTGLDLSACSAMPLTATGGIQADRDGLAECGDDLLESFAKVSETRKLKDTYLPWLKLGTQWPINTNANVLLATGRVSFDGLLQLIPRGHGIRECVVPRPGMALCSVDYDAVELSTLAQAQLVIVGSSVLGEAITGGLDPHSFFAAQMIGVDYDSFMVILRDTSHPLNKKYKGYRQAAKAANFGFPGGMGAPTLVRAQRKIGLRFCKILAGADKCGAEKVTLWKKRPTPPVCLKCVELAETLKAQWMAQWPEMRAYFEFVNECVSSSGEMVQLGSGRIRGGLDFCNGANTLFQGLAADGAKAALWDVTRACYDTPESPLYGSRVVLFIHDEIIIETPLETAAEAGAELARVMVLAMKEWVPDVKVSASPALMLAWSKDASAEFDKGGRLIPWVKK
jgi:DNA polymerase-1